MKSIQFRGHEVFYEKKGEGFPVVLLHGFLENHTMWNAISEQLTNLGCEVMAIDLPCHGKSRFKGEVCSMPWMAEVVDHILTHEHYTNPFVFGHSMGGYVGLELLKFRSIRLTLVHSNLWADSEQKQLDRDRVIEIVKKNKGYFLREAIPHLFAPENREPCSDVIAQLIAEAEKIPVHEIQASTAGMRDRLPNEQLLDTHQITIIHGEKDPIISTEGIVKLLEERPHQPALVIIKNCGHMSIWERPEALIKSMKNVIFR